MVQIVSPTEATRALSSLLLNPWADNVIARWPDQYTMIPTLAAKDIAHFPLTIFNGTTSADGCAGLYVRGDPNGTYQQPSLIGGILPGKELKEFTTNYEIAWNNSVNNLNQSMPNADGASAYARPVGMGTRLTFSGVGTYHTIVLRVMELPPWGWLGASGHPTNFPVAANLGPTFMQREYFRAREIVMKPGDTINFLNLPASGMGLTFLPVSKVRDDVTYSAPGQSWSGYVIWIFGLQSNDTVYTDICIHHEYYLPPPVAAISSGSRPRVLVKPSEQQVENVESQVIDTVAYGWNIFKTVITEAANVFTSLAPFLVEGGRAGAVPPISNTALVPTVMSSYSMLADPPRLWAGRNELTGELLKPFQIVPPTLHPAVPAPVVEEKEPYEDLSKSCLLKELKKRM